MTDEEIQTLYEAYRQKRIEWCEAIGWPLPVHSDGEA